MPDSMRDWELGLKGCASQQNWATQRFLSNGNKFSGRWRIYFYQGHTLLNGFVESFLNFRINFNLTNFLAQKMSILTWKEEETEVHIGYNQYRVSRNQNYTSLSLRVNSCLREHINLIFELILVWKCGFFAFLIY